ncbi:MAG: DUF4040 domain-containing protein [Alphaproteobacteria bacterium]
MTDFISTSFMEHAVTILLFVLLAVTAIAVLRLTNLFAVVMLTGAYSLLSAVLFVVLDAVDVAFTEASVGAGISTVLMLATLSVTGWRRKVSSSSNIVPLLVTLVVGGALLYGTADMPDFGDPNAPANLHVAPDYIKGSEEDIDVPNIVTSVLASYRSFDTLGETGVIFTAGIGVMLLLGSRRKKKAATDKTGETA